MKKIQMPAMSPVPINTKNLIWYTALWSWLFSFRKWEILEDWYLSVDWADVYYLIPKGFVFDGASIPRILWMVFSPVGILFIPGLLHDFVYRYGVILVLPKKEGIPVPLEYTRSESDAFFKKIAIMVNGFKYLNWLPYMALVFCGWPTWHSHRKNNKDVYVDFPTIKRFKMED